MAYLHGELPAPAPTKARSIAVAARRSMPSSGLMVRLAAAAAILLALFFVGRAATLATESLAIGIIAADLAFLIAVAGWSAFAIAPKR